jgi:HAD superfamily hydrolase (TIGR01509 family)
MTMQKIKAVIFDLDGLVIDSEYLWTEMEMIYLREKNISYNGELHYELMGLKQEEVNEKFRTYFGIDEPFDKMLAHRKQILYKLYDEKLKLRPFVREILGMIRKNDLRTAMASGSPLDIIERALKKFSLEKAFSPIVSADHVQRGKPEPDIYLKTCELMSLEPYECIVLEDSFNGVKSAVSAGAHCIAVPETSDPNDFSIADFVAKDLLEAGNIISRVR